MRKILSGIYFLVLWLEAIGQNNRPPNILWITTEDMSTQPGYFGNSIAQTPVLDQLAEKSIRYTNFYSVSGVRAPSRSALITGIYPASIGTLHHQTGKKRCPAVPAYEVVPRLGTCRAGSKIKYIKNYHPERPCVQYLPYRDQMVFMQAVIRLHNEGQLDAHAQWVEATGDLGAVAEDEMIARMRPCRKQPVTEKLVFKEIFAATGRASISCLTPDVSVAYRIGEEGRWLLYTQPVAVSQGKTLYAKAIRHDYQESEAVKQNFNL